MKVSQPSFAFAVPAAPIEKAEDLHTRLSHLNNRDVAKVPALVNDIAGVSSPKPDADCLGSAQYCSSTHVRRTGNPCVTYKRTEESRSSW